MVTRTISGLIGGLLVLAIIIFNQSFPFLINIFVSTICVLTTYEIYAALGIDKTFEIMIPSVVFAGVAPIFGMGFMFNMSLYIYTIVAFFIMLFFRKLINFKDAMVVFSMTLIITFSLSALIEIRNITKVYSSFYVLFTLAISWMTDTGAYFTGKFFGKHKLCPEVSPKKTVEGAFGGIVISILSSIFICFIFNKFFLSNNLNVNYQNAIVICLFGSIISIMGDLCFSMFKRIYRIKDFGNVIPGHGGVLDRFDSVIFVVPFIYFIVKHTDILNIFS